MEFDKVVELRKSVRDFKNKKINWKKILDAIYSALQGPFAGNNNNLKFLIIENKESIEEVAHFCDQTWISNSPALIVVLSDDTHLEEVYGERGRVYSRQQAGAAIITILFKLVDVGLSACWVGAYSDELIKTKFGIPQHIQIEAIIPIGYEGKSEKKPDKKSIENSLFWEKWDMNRRPTLFEENLSENSLISN